MSIPANAPNSPTPAGNGQQPDDVERIRDLNGYRLARLESEVLAPARDTVSAEARLQRLISAYVSLAMTDPGIVPLLSDCPLSSSIEATSTAVPESVASFLSALRNTLTEVIGAQEHASSIEPEVVVQSLVGIIHWGINCHRAEGRLKSGEAVTQITSLALHGLVPRRPEVARMG